MLAGLLLFQIFLAIILALWKASKEREKRERQRKRERERELHQKRSTPTIKRTVQHRNNNDELTRIREAKYQKEAMIRAFWQKAHVYAHEYISQYDMETLKEFIYNIWNTRDKFESAIDLHFFLNDVVNALYKIRNYNEGYYSLIEELCTLDLSNFNNYIKRADKPPPYLFDNATRLAIILENKGKIIEAIELCDFCIEHKIIDKGYRSFSDRKEHLIRKAPVRDVDIEI